MLGGLIGNDLIKAGLAPVLTLTPDGADPSFIDANWTDPYSTETGFTLQFTDSPTFAIRIDQYIHGPNETSEVITSHRGLPLVSGRMYYARVRGEFGAISGPWSVAVSYLEP